LRCPFSDTRNSPAAPPTIRPMFRMREKAFSSSGMMPLSSSLKVGAAARYVPGRPRFMARQSHHGPHEVLWVGM
jgi:hypothetical protein